MYYNGDDSKVDERPNSIWVSVFTLTNSDLQENCLLKVTRLRLPTRGWSAVNKATCTCWPEEDAERKRERGRGREGERERSFAGWMGITMEVLFCRLGLVGT